MPFGASEYLISTPLRENVIEKHLAGVYVLGFLVHGEITSLKSQKIVSKGN